jgi:hypothetical protein
VTSEAARSGGRVEWIGRLAGVAAIGSSLASAAWALGFAPAAGFPDRWITIWNLLLVPAAVWIGFVLVRTGEGGGRLLAAVAAVAGALSCALWATAWQRSDLEALWIGLSAAWWVPTGWLLVRRGVRGLGWFTVVVGAFAVLDAVVTLAGDEGTAFLLASPKLPLGWFWALLAGGLLLDNPMLRPREREGGTPRGPRAGTVD